jgi:AraC-like DNA-binding protein
MAMAWADINLDKSIISHNNPSMFESGLTVINGGSDTVGPDWSRASWISEPWCKIYAIHEGSGSYELAGAPPVRLHPGLLAFIPHRRPSRHTAAPGLRVDWLHLRLDDPVSERLALGLPEIRTWPLAAWTAHTAGWEACAHLDRHAVSARHAACAFAHAVLAAALAGLALPGSFAAALDRLTTATAWLDQHCASDPPLTQVARQAGLSAVQFRRRFTAVYGCTPRTWAERRRLDRACRLLRSGASVGTTATACGYADPFHFSRVFRRVIGCAPSAYALGA